MKYLTHEEAESLAGVRLDKRRKWFIWGKDVCCNDKETLSCSGCSCDCEGGCSCCGKRGAGCHECGYTGKRVFNFPVPHQFVALASNLSNVAEDELKND